MRLFCLVVIGIFFCSCASVPYFGTPILEHHSLDRLKSSWFHLPDQYAMKHLVVLKMKKQPPTEFIGYMFAKKQNFRLLAMNELGITMLDIYSEKDKKPWLIKSPGMLKNEQAIRRMVQDIRLTFLAISLPSDKQLDEYETKAHSRVFVRQMKNVWYAWEIMDNHPVSITCGKGKEILSVIRYDYQEGSGSFSFPNRVLMSYPLFGFSVELTIFSIREKFIPDSRIKPGDLL